MQASVPQTRSGPRMFACLPSLAGTQAKGGRKDSRYVLHGEAACPAARVLRKPVKHKFAGRALS